MAPIQLCQATHVITIQFKIKNNRLSLGLFTMNALLQSSHPKKCLRLGAKAAVM